MDSITLLALNILRNHPDLLNIRDISPPDVCPICYETIWPSVIPYVVLSCNHIFHYDCIQQQLNVNDTCPLCRSIIITGNSTTAYPVSGISTHETSPSFDMEQYEFMDEFQENDNESQHSTYSEINEETSTSDCSIDSRTKEIQRRNRLSRVEGLLHEITAEPVPVDIEIPDLVTYPDLTEPEEMNEALDEIPYEMISMDTCLESSSSIPNDYISNRKSKGIFARLIQKVVNAEKRADRENQETILCYYRFGKAMYDRFNEIKETDNCPTQSARVKLNEEIKNQIPESISSAKYNKMKEKASKLYDLFNAIGEDKIRMIHSFSADSISRLTRSEIEHIIQHSHKE